MRSSVNNCSGRCCSGWGQGKSGQCNMPARRGGAQMSSMKPRFESSRSYRSYTSPQIRVVQPRVVKSAVRNNIGKAWGSDCVLCNQGRPATVSQRAVQSRVRNVSQPQRGCQSPSTRVGSSCRMLTGPSGGGNIQTADCFRVGGCNQPTLQDQYEVAQYEYDTGMNRVMKTADRPRIEVLDYDNSSDASSSYTIDCIDCEQTSENTGNYRPRPTVPQQQENAQNQQREEHAQRNRGWSSWSSWGSKGSEYHESEGYHQQPVPQNENSMINRFYTSGQNAFGQARQIGSGIRNRIGKYSYSWGCFYYSC